ncbi:MAG TPA: hypothetical protein VFG79_07005 [Solirubrobacter sp.]|nr:hypothetical protein [Solirubrobacter sp.]
MKLRMVIAATAISGVAAPAAWAQTPPVGGGIPVGGSVPSFLELILAQPTKAAFSKFPKAHRTYSMSFTAEITTTDAPTLLTLTDGDVTRGSKLGHLVRGHKRMPLPLQARVGKRGYQSLAQSVDPLLTTWTDAVTRDETKVRLRQRVKGKARGSYRKLVLVTVSPDTP